MTIISTIMGRIPHKIWISPQSQQKVRNAVLGYNLKNDRMTSVHFQGKPFIITVTQVCASTSNAGRTVLRRPTKSSRTKTKKDVPFIIGGWNAKEGSQKTPGVTGKFGLGVQNEAGKRLIEFCQENALVLANTLFQQHKKQLYTWTSPAGQYQNQIDYILCSQRWRALYSWQKQDWELVVAQIMNSLLQNLDLN